ncbi:insulinase family protein [Candidatus Fermentibacteria bacterium]|nr:insulinase family protein [Candidatus Fermentibacteria bacterium]
MRTLALIALATGAWANPFSAAVDGTLSNGLRVIVLPDQSLPVVSSTVLVGAGSEREDETTSGATHLLEHLLFNGTASMTQEQLYETMDLHGLYVNAATRERGTILIGLSAPDELETLLRVQAEMLFSSTIAPEKFEKEKLIVLEEIAKDRSRPDDFLWLHRARSLYDSSPCRFPILGSPATVAAMPRETILDYYHRHYVPNNMTLLLIGRFSWPLAWELLQGAFGTAPPAPVPPATPCPFAQARVQPDTIWAPLPSASLSATFEGPGPHDPSFPSFFLASLLLPQALTRVHDSAVSSWDGSLHIGPDACRLTLSAGVVSPDSCGVVSGRMNAILESALAAGDDDLRRAAGEWRNETVRWLERPHMLAVMAYDLLTSLGWDGLAGLWEALGEVDSDGWRRDVAPYLVSPVASLYELPTEETPSYEGLDPVPTVSTLPQASGPLPVVEECVPNLPPIVLEEEGTFVDAADTLPSGVVIWVRSEPGIELAGMHILLRQRGALEPPGKEGVAELLHRTVGTGPAHMTEELFLGRLADLGAALQVSDNPWIPFDDYYYSSRWGYVRLTAPAESLETAAALLAHALYEPRADSTILHRERSAMAAALAREGRSPGKAAVRRLWARLKPGDPREHSPLGLPETVSTLRGEDVRDFARDYVVGPNMVVTLSTPLDADSALAGLAQVFEAVPAGEQPPPVLRTLSSEVWRLDDSLGVGQGHLLMASAVSLDEHERPAVELLAALLDRRMGLVLRERYGLAYSLGAQASFEDGVALITASVGTRAERLQEAEERLQGLVAELASDAFADSLERRAAAMSFEQRARLRSLTRVGRAFSMAMDLLAGRPPASPGAVAAVRDVRAEELRDVAARIEPEALMTISIR